MDNASAIGWVVIGLGALVTLFFAMYKPLSGIAVTLERINIRLDGMEERQAEFEREMEKYKEQVRQSQARQWQHIDKNEENIKMIAYKLGVDHLQ